MRLGKKGKCEKKRNFHSAFLSIVCKGVQTNHPKMYNFGMKIISSWKQSSPKRLRKKLWPSLQHLPEKKCRPRTCTRKGIITLCNDSIIWTRYGTQEGTQQGLLDQSPLYATVSRWPSKHLFTKHWLFPFFLWIAFLPFEAWTPIPFSSGPEWHYISHVACFWNHIFFFFFLPFFFLNWGVSYIKYKNIKQTTW